MKTYLLIFLMVIFLAALAGAGVYYVHTQPPAPHVPITAKLPEPTTEQWSLSMQLQNKHQALVDPDRKQIMVDRVYWESLTDNGKEDVAANLLVVAGSMDTNHQCYDVADLKTGKVLATWRHTGWFPALVLTEKGP